ncbi:MAG: serine/threonine-protein kinase [Planctomycetota bacterium]
MDSEAERAPEPQDPRAEDLLDEQPDDALEELIAEVLLAPSGERGVALEAACAVHPALADALRERWSALQAVGLDGLLAPSDPSASAVPDVLGDFEIGRALGGGGMGVVYAARQLSLDREVALKLMRPEGLYFADVRERFRREAEAIARLEHPNIVKVFSFGEERGVPYFAMERIDGRTCNDVLEALAGRAPGMLSGADLCEAVEGIVDASAAPLFERSWTDACVEVARQVAVALEHAHGQGIVHRDVKPSNVAVTRDGRVQLLDFGLAGSDDVDRLTRSGGQLGTIGYMAPEQIRGERELDARCDVYALGLTLYELLTLRNAFGGETRHQVEADVLGGAVVAPRALNARVSLDLERVCLKAMDVDPARRYPTAAAFADDLLRVLEKRTVSARSPGVLLRARRWAQRHPALAVGAVAAFGLFGVAPATLYVRELAYSEELATSLRAEQRALREATASLQFVERLFISSDPYRGANPDMRVKELIRDRIAEFQRMDGLEGLPRLEARLALGLAGVACSFALQPEALPLAERAYALERELGEPIVTNETRPAQILAQALSGTGARDEAIALIRGELERESAYDAKGRANLSFKLGDLLIGRLEYAEAEVLLRAALEHYAPPEGDLAEGNMSIRWRLAAALSGQGRHGEALMEAEPTVDIARALYPEEHPAVAESMHQMGTALAGLGEVDEAIDLQMEATEIIDGFYGPASAPSYRFHSDLANLLGIRGDFELGTEEAERALEIARELYGDEAQPTIDARTVVEVYRRRRARNR